MGYHAPRVMKQRPITKDIKRFVRLNLSDDRWNTQFPFQVVFLLLLAASWRCSTIHAQAATPDADTVYLRFNYQSLEAMEQEFYRRNKALLGKLRWDKRKRLFLVVDETHDPYYGKKHYRWLHAFRSARGSTGSFEFLTFAIVAPGQWRRVMRCMPIPRHGDKAACVVDTAQKIRAQVRYSAVLLDRGFYDKGYALSLQRAGIPLLIRAEMRGRWKRRCARISSAQRHMHWQQEGHGPLYLWLGWKHLGKKRQAWGFLTNLPSLSWFMCLSWYKQRWNLENVFKATDGIQFRTATAKITPRLFAVLLSFLVYNAWQEDKHNKTAPRSLSVFLEELFNRTLRTYLAEGPPFVLHLLGWLVQRSEAERSCSSSSCTAAHRFFITSCSD